MPLINQTTPETQAFLDELAELSKKHGIYLFICGCCPGVGDEQGNDIHHKLWYENDKYYVD